MRSDLKDNTDTINKMIQFGTVKYGIVKQLKDRSRSDRDTTDDQDENGSCSPIVDCKSVSPDIAIGHDEDHNHNNNSMTEDDQESRHRLANSTLKAEQTYLPNVENRIPTPVELEAKESRLEDGRGEEEVEEEENMSDGEAEEQAAAATKAVSEAIPEVEARPTTVAPQPPAPALDVITSLPQMPQFPPGPVTLEAIQSMQMAIAQFAAKTIANGGNGADNEAAMKQLAFLQQTLFNLQQQQLFQIQLIQQLQSQIAMNHQMKDDELEEGEINEDDEEEMEMEDEEKSHHHHQDVQCNQKDLHADETAAKSIKYGGECDDRDESNSTESLKRKREADGEDYDELKCRRTPIDITAIKQDENMPLPYGSDLASSIITNHDDLPGEPNSLEMLQKRAQEVLDSASQGILANNLADEFAFGKDKSADGKNRNEPFFKHRCRYCGKVFGSDSALQIHIRSHTGERPFKCNVCGSRFTTKGNLKVHFQRHAQKFPHIPMNATPIPEHLDKFHPPLLESMSPDSSPTHQPQMPHVPNVPVSLPLPFPPGAGFPGLPALYRPPMDILKSLGSYTNPFFTALPPLPPVTPTAPLVAADKSEQDMPTDLRKHSAPSSPEKIKEEPEEKVEKDEPLSLKIKEEKLDDEPTTPAALKERSPAPRRSQSPPPPPHLQPTPPASTPSTTPIPPGVMQPHLTATHPQASPRSMPPQSVELLPTPGQLPPMFHHREDYLHDHRFPLNFTRTSPERRSPIRSPASIPRSPFFVGPMKHEMTLLPRPHSNDNSWENFIEVSNTSETLKLKELMKNKKLTDPNQCVVCDRVLSCKSALQMHYRTHTGERPFKCRICGRAFTTKGNLKTHMAVHKIRPPMRNFHQCPVCHKKYSNALVLQQHIRLHTGEPTDLTPEQIQAAEIRDPPPSMMPAGAFLNPFAFHFGMGGGGGHPNGGGHHMGSESSQGDMDDNMDCSDDFDDDMSDHMSNGGDSSANDRPKSSEDIKGMLFEQKLKIENHYIRPKSRTTSTGSAPTSPVSASLLNKSSASPAPSEASQGALDLTPRAVAPATAASPPPPVHRQPATTTPPHQPPKYPSPQHHHQNQHHQQHLQQQQQQHLQQLHHHHHHQHQQPLSQNPAALMATRPPFGMFPNIPLFPPVGSSTQNMCNAMNSIAQSVMPAAPFNPLALSGVRGSTTCGICFKTFPCHSALEIHYRSHTKERPFKCSICDRGFTTKGNLKQHMLTHKIRDMEQETFRNRAVKYMSGWKEEYE